MMKCVWADNRTEIVLWLTTRFRCTDAQFLCYVHPRWKRESTFLPIPSSILPPVVKVDSEAGGFYILLWVEFEFVGLVEVG